MPDPIYLDHAATSPLHPTAFEAMLPWLQGGYGNPSALYRLGREAQSAIDTAREQVAEVLNARSSEVIFTSGGSESVNAALRGIALAGWIAGTATHIVTTAVEHHAVLHTCEALERLGIAVTMLPPDADGWVSPESVVEAIRPETGVVSMMVANNEVGTLLPVAQTVQLVQARARALGKRIAFHTDAVQAPGWLAVDTQALGVDVLSLSAHKFGGPKGVGILYLRRDVPFAPQQTGGGQERQRRAGTENVAGIVGTGVALRLAEEQRPSTAPRIARLRDRVIDRLLTAIPGAQLNGARDQRVHNNINVSIPGIVGDLLVQALDHEGVAASAGSACANTTWEPSHVLIAMGQTGKKAESALRLTIGPEQRQSDVDAAIATIVRVTNRLRHRSDALATGHAYALRSAAQHPTITEA